MAGQDSTRPLETGDSTVQHRERENQPVIFSWELRRVLKGNAKTQARTYIRSLDDSCFFCKLALGYGTPDIHHIDENPEDNRLYNLALAHHGCNSSDFNQKKQHGIASSGHGGVRENGGQRPAEWTTEEGRRSDKMTYCYRQFLYHPKTGLLRNGGQLFSIKWLAAMLPSELKIGKSVTYRRYIDEDIAGGFLEPTVIDGTDKVERTTKPYPLELLEMREPE
ncbi:MAG: hypothetical protein ABSF83_09225 [Nitrososphaerales archaeon]|jgi:hypothetical protein